MNAPGGPTGATSHPFGVGARVYDLAARTHVMGIVNVTPDSFSGDGLAGRPDEAIKRALRMVEDGADIIDVGGRSTRPGSDEVSIDDELARVIPLITHVTAVTDCPVSIDTTNVEVARAAVDAGAAMINDIAGLTDPEMRRLAAERDVPAAIMHMKGSPKDMQIEPVYEGDIIEEIGGFLLEQARVAEADGVPHGQILIDPGIGFGKTREHNLQIMRRLPELARLGYPVLLGTSRKSFIGLTLGLPVEDRLEGTAATVAYGIAQGAAVVRVHDVREMVRVARMTDAMMRA